MNQYDFYLTYLETHGMTHEQAVMALELDAICHTDSARREFNDIKKDKDREAQEECRKKYSPNPARQAMNIYEKAKEIRESKEKNFTMF